jgi:hypothetical protein
MTVITYTKPTELADSTLYEVSVNGTPVPVAHTPVGDFVNFSTDESVDIVITHLPGTIVSSVIGPKSASITKTTNGDELSFTVGNGKYYVNINDPGDIDDTVSSWVPLFIFSNELEDNPLDSDPLDPDIIWLGPGVYSVEEDGTIVSGTGSLPGGVPSSTYYDLRSNKTLYIHGSAVLRGRVRIGEAVEGGGGRTNATITGRGVIDSSVIFGAESGAPLRIQNSSSCTVDGVTLLGSRHWGLVSRKSSGNTINNVKVFSWRKVISEDTGGVPEGMVFVSTHNTNITDVFVRSYGNGIALRTGQPALTFGAPREWVGPCYGLTFDGGLVYSAWGGNGLEIGPDVPQTISNCTFKNMSIYHKTLVSSALLEAISIYAEGGGNVHSIKYEDIWIDWATDRYVGILTGGTGSIWGIRLDDITLAQDPRAAWIEAGHGPGGEVGNVADVVFNNLTGNGGTSIVNESSDVKLILAGLNVPPDAVDFNASVSSTLPLTIGPKTDIFVKGAPLPAGSTHNTGVLEIKNSPELQFDRKTFIKFRIPSGITTVTTANLRLYASNLDGSAPITVFPVTNDEAVHDATIWPGPSNGDGLATVTVDTVNTWYSWNITTYVNTQLANKEKFISLLLFDNTVSDKLITFHSLAGTNPPELSLT